jgi:phosphopantothenoylcysteine decarboxylase/phosphopantothenate--cysteine ligase
MNVLLGVGGGIAAYKSVELVRRFVEGGDEVQVLMTAAAKRLVTPRTFAVLSRRTVHSDIWEGESAPGVDHVTLARWADVFVVAPATADLVAKLANGLADDFLTTLALAFTGRLVLAPSMNHAMLAHPATQENLRRLAERGAVIIEPETGFLAEGESGPGRLPEPAQLASRIRELVATGGSLAGRTILVTAGPTREPIDPVRFVSNASSGRMGFAIAAEAKRRGARVLLVSGPVELVAPPAVELVRVETASEMHREVTQRIGEADAAILVAAVADVAPADPASSKIPKGSLPSSLPLVPTVDILAELGRLPAPRPLLVGFAAATGDEEGSGREKLLRKGCDMIVANDVSRPEIGFGSDENEVVILTRDAPPLRIGRTKKSEIAARILDLVEPRLARRP